MKHEASITVFPVKWLTRLAGGLLLATGLFLISPFVFAADNPQDDAAFTCSSAVNVMDCIKQTGTGAPAPTQPLDVTALPINSGLLGFTGPVSVGIRYDNYLAWILDFGYVQSFLDNNAAAALKLSAGLNERRANVSLGYAITSKQQIKLTYEYLAQNLPFDFASGKVDEWVNQNALGASYRYIIGHNILKNIEVYGTYTKAASRELSEKEMYLNNLLTQINYRRIAGGTEMTAGGNVTLAPLKGTILKVGAGYSSLSFDTKWQNNEATAALVYNAELAHLLTPTTLVSAGIGNTASGRTHTAKVSQILPWSLEASLIGQYVATTNEIPGSTSVSASLSYPAPKTYENMITAGLSSIKDWVEKPVVYHSRVLAKAEERVVQVQITTRPIPPANIAVGTTLNPTIQTKDYFAFNPEVYDKISYQITSVTQKGNPNNVFTPEALGLQIAPVDSYNARINSSTPVQASAMTPGDYTVTISASGYRKGQIVSQVNSPLDITVGGNPDLKAPSWKNGATVANATTNTEYPGTDLHTLIVDNSGLAGGDSFTFELSPTKPSWVQLSQDTQTMIANGIVPIDAKNPSPVTINATSKVSGKSVTLGDGTPSPKEFEISVVNAGVNPAWTSNSTLPNATYQVDYLNAGINVNLNDPTYLSTGFEGASVMQFTCEQNCQASNSGQQELPIAGLKLTNSGPNAGLITGKPTDVSQIGFNKTFNVTALNVSTGLPTKNAQTFNIQLMPNKSTLVFSAQWIPNKNLLPASAGKDYSSTYVYAKDFMTISTQTASEQPVSDSYRYSIGKDNSCTWLTVDPTSSLLGGKAGNTNCNADIAVQSSATDTIKDVGIKAITISKGPVWITTSLNFIPKYYDDNLGKITINSNSVNSETNSLRDIYLSPDYPTIPKWLSLIQVNSQTININSDTQNDNLIGQVSLDETSCTPETITLRAADDAGSTDQPFPSCLLANSTLIAPQISTNPIQFTYGQAQTIRLNPYLQTADQTYITKTFKNPSTPVQDQLTFKNIINSCGWNTLDSTGLLVGTNNTTAGNCDIKFDLESRARGITIAGSVNIITTGTSPTWSPSTINTQIKYSAINITDGIPLNTYLNKGTLIGFNIVVDSQNTPNSGRWDVKNDNNGNYFLVRKLTDSNQLDASDINQKPAVVLIASNAAGSSSATFNVQVNPDPDTKIEWIGSSPLVLSAGEAPQNYLLYNPANIDSGNNIRMCAGSPCITVIRDTVAMASTNMIVLKGGTPIAVSQSGGAYTMNIPTLNPTDNGTYNTLKLPAFSSLAAGISNKDVTPSNLSLQVNSALAWKPDLPTNSAVAFDDQGKNNVIDLNAQIVPGTEGSNLNFDIANDTPNRDNWDINTVNPAEHYLIRKGLDAGDIGPAKVNITATNASSSATAIFNVLVQDDPNIQITWREDQPDCQLTDIQAYTNKTIADIRNCIYSKAADQIVNDYYTFSTPITTLPEGTVTLTDNTLTISPHANAVNTQTTITFPLISKAKGESTVNLQTGQVTIIPNSEIFTLKWNDSNQACALPFINNAEGSSANNGNAKILANLSNCIQIYYPNDTLITDANPTYTMADHPFVNISGTNLISTASMFDLSPNKDSNVVVNINVQSNAFIKPSTIDNRLINVKSFTLLKSSTLVLSS